MCVIFPGGVICHLSFGIVYKYIAVAWCSIKQTKAFQSLQSLSKPLSEQRAWVVTSTSRRCVVGSTTARWLAATRLRRSGRWHSARRCSAAIIWSRSTAGAWPCITTTSRCTRATGLPATLLTTAAAAAALCNFLFKKKTKNFKKVAPF